MTYIVVITITSVYNQPIQTLKSETAIKKNFEKLSLWKFGQNILQFPIIISPCSYKKIKGVGQHFPNLLQMKT